MRKTLIALASLAIVLILLWVAGPGVLERRLNVVEAHDRWPVSEQARSLHDRLLVADLHADSLLWDRDLNVRADRGHVDFPRLRDGNVALQVFPAVTRSPSGQNYEHNDTDAFDNITLVALLQGWPPRTWNSLTQRALYQADRLHRFIDASDTPILLIETREDVEELRLRRKAGEPVLGALLATEGSHALDGLLDNVDRLHQAGFRMMSLQHFFDNKLGGSLHGSSKQGLTLFGKQVVARILGLGIALDLAHSSEQVVADVLDISDAPVLISHTGTQGHCDSPRNINDDLMKRVAMRGGIIGIGFWDDAVCDATPAGLARQIKAAVDLVGPDAVALGSDYDGTISAYFDVSEMAAITSALLASGMDDSTIAKVMGENVFAFLERALAVDPAN